MTNPKITPCLALSGHGQKHSNKTANGVKTKPTNIPTITSRYVPSFSLYFYKKITVVVFMLELND